MQFADWAGRAKTKAGNKRGGECVLFPQNTEKLEFLIDFLQKHKVQKREYFLQRQSFHLCSGFSFLSIFVTTFCHSLPSPVTSISPSLLDFCFTPPHCPPNKAQIFWHKKSLPWTGFFLPVLHLLLCYFLYLWIACRFHHTQCSFFLISVASRCLFCLIRPSPSLHLAKSCFSDAVHILSSKSLSLTPQDRVRSLLYNILYPYHCKYHIVLIISCLYVFFTLKTIGSSRMGTYQTHNKGCGT